MSPGYDKTPNPTLTLLQFPNPNPNTKHLTLTLTLILTLPNGNPGQTADYETFDVATTAVFRLILSDFDYSHLKHISREIAPFYFYFYATVVVFIMLNMFIAIINAAFQAGMNQGEGRA